MKVNRSDYLLVLFIIVKFALQYTLISSEYELHRDEFLHLDQGKHLAWGFLSVPPLTSWVSFIIQIFGNGLFWVKFFPALFGVMTMIVVWKTVKALNGGLFAMTLSATAILLSAILRLNILYQPNSADVFFWTLLYFLIIRYFQSNEPKWLYYAGIAFGFGFLTS